MADFTSLKQTIQSYVKQNGNEEITGNILQDVLLAMVSTMGDSAINGLASALQDEINARQNQDGILQGNITEEATLRQQADTTLGGRIDGLQTAVNGLQTAVNGINTKLAEGYIYAGIATPSTNPGTINGKVLYVAVQAGTYTNFSSLAVTQGITILKNNGTAWSQEQIIAIDDVPTAGSESLVKSGGVHEKVSQLGQFVENHEYIQVTTDNKDKILEGITSEGVKQINLPIDTPAATIESVDNPEWIEVKTDAKGRMLEGMRVNGKKVFPGGIEGVASQEEVDALKNNLEIGQVIDDSIGLITLTNMQNLTPISDGLKVLASGECNFYHEVSTGLVYVVAVEGNHNAYEANDFVTLYVYSLTNPNLVKRFEIASRQQGCYTGNIIPLSNKKVRVFYSYVNEDSNGGYGYYRDFDFSNETLTEPEKIQLNGSDLKATDIRNYTVAQGYSAYETSLIYIQKITEEMSDGYRYATCSCGESISYNLTLLRSNDNFVSVELIAVLPYLTRYDCAVAGLGSKLYFVHRIAGDEYAATSGSALFTADITDLNNIVWSADIKFAEGDSRTDCYLYNNKIYLMAGNLHSIPGYPRRISSSVWEGISDNPFDYKKVLVVNDSRGVQNPRIFRYGVGDYGVLMQNSPARIDYPNGWTQQWQFKTAVCFVHTRIN